MLLCLTAMAGATQQARHVQVHTDTHSHTQVRTHSAHAPPSPPPRYGTKLLIMALKNDELIGHQILDRGGVWDGMALGIMLDYLHQGVNVVDAGANIGSYTVYYAYKIGNNASVYAFEPQNLVYQVRRMAGWGGWLAGHCRGRVCRGM